jgi:hypothetical protein
MIARDDNRARKLVQRGAAALQTPPTIGNAVKSVATLLIVQKGRQIAVE